MEIIEKPKIIGAALQPLYKKGLLISACHKTLIYYMYNILTKIYQTRANYYNWVILKHIYEI